jgi:hypothetical protein
LDEPLAQLILSTPAHVSFGRLIFSKQNIRGRSYRHQMKSWRQLRLSGTMSLLKSCRACSLNGFNE